MPLKFLRYKSQIFIKEKKNLKPNPPTHNQTTQTNVIQPNVIFNPLENVAGNNPKLEMYLYDLNIRAFQCRWCP